MLKNIVIISTLIIIVIAVYFPSRHARHYNYISVKDMLNELDLKWPQNNRVLKNCSYNEIVTNDEDIEISSIKDKREFKKPLLGGEFIPDDCIALEKTAIIVPYRNRSYHLNIFVKYMHWFLQKQKLHYRIFVVNQNDSLPFNRAKMINYGAKMSIRLQYHCLILHDVDLIPINTRNIYACSKLPRHMSSSLDTFRYNLPYLTLFGGAVSITSEQFLKVNGMSNEFFGWGGEDDDFYRRLIYNNLEPCRFSPEVSKYTMLPHRKEDARSCTIREMFLGFNEELDLAQLMQNFIRTSVVTPGQCRWTKYVYVSTTENRFRTLEKTKEMEKIDGLNSISSSYIIKLEELYTLLIVP